jgi:hypothetical protein
MQSEFPRLIKRISDHLGVQRKIYIGGSSGGFAALYYSLCDPGSVCIAVNPQTNLVTYKNAERQLRLVWPAASSIAEIGKRVTIDLPAAYDSGFENMIVYLQSNGDLRHYGTQMSVFCKVGLKQPERFILQCGYWGVPGHSHSIPINEYRVWVKAISKTTWFDRPSILDAYHTLISTSQHFPPTHGQPKPLPSRSDTHANQQSLRIADLLRDHQLRKNQYE